MQWLLMDYLDVVVHLFRPEARAYYRLERLWGDVPQLRLSEQTLRLCTVTVGVPEEPSDAAGKLS
jgi:hypothetical protein